MQSPVVRAALVLAPVVVASVGLVVLGLALLVFASSSGFGYDFRAYDDAARRLLAGDGLYLPGSADAYREGRFEGLYLYPPTLAVALMPLALADQQTATLVWMLLRAGLLVTGCLVLPVSWRTRAIVLGMACLSFPILFDLNIGNVSIVIFALCAAAWRWMDTPIAAVAHAALIAVRFPFGIFALTWWSKRDWRTFGWTIVAGLAMIAISLPFVGLGSYADYVSILLGLPDISVGEHNQSLKSLALELGLPDPIPAIALPIGYLLGMASVVFAARSRDVATAFVVSAMATLLVAPFIHPHYLVLLLLPTALLVERGRWWAFGLPLLGWLPDVVMPIVGPFAIAIVLLFGATVRGGPQGPELGLRNNA